MTETAGSRYSVVTSRIAAAFFVLLAGATGAFARAAVQAPAAPVTGQAGSQAQAPASAAPAAGQDEGLPLTNVAGHWELNWRQSDKPPETLGRGGEPGEGEGGRGGMGGPPPGGGMGGRGGRMGRHVRGERSDGTARDEVRDAVQTSRTLLIVEHPDHVTITNEDGVVRRLTITPGETRIKEELAGGKSVERRNRWDGRKLIAEAVTSGGTRVTETFEKVAEGLQLIVTTRIENKRFGKPLELKRVYDQALEAK